MPSHPKLDAVEPVRLRFHTRPSRYLTAYLRPDALHLRLQQHFPSRLNRRYTRRCGCQPWWARACDSAGVFATGERMEFVCTEVQVWSASRRGGSRTAQGPYGESTVSRAETVKVETMVETRIALETRST